MSTSTGTRIVETDVESRWSFYRKITGEVSAEFGYFWIWMVFRVLLMF